MISVRESHPHTLAGGALLAASFSLSLSFSTALLFRFCGREELVIEFATASNLRRCRSCVEV